MGFQSTFNIQQAAAVAGDFASLNPRRSHVGHEGNLVAGANGLTVARFGWKDAAGTVSNAGTGKPTGFVHRQQAVALITEYLAESSNLIQKGFAVTLMESGDYWVEVTGAVASVGKKVFASLTTGQIQPGAAGATIAGFVETDFTITGFPVGGTGAIGELAVMSR